MKHGQMGGNWIFTSRTKSFTLNNTLCYKNLTNNTSVGAEAIILLELMEFIERKGRETTSEQITVGIDNSKVHRRLIKSTLKPCICTQDARTITS